MPADLQTSLQVLKIMSFLRGFSSFVKLIYFYRNSQVSKILFISNYSGIKNEMLQLFTCDVLHLFFLIKNVSSDCPVFPFG